jgi:hypothetical protein
VSSSALLEKNLSSSKLNAQALVFVPRAQVVIHVGGLIPSSFTKHSLPEKFIKQEVVGSEPESVTTPTPSSKAILIEELRQKVVKQVEFYFSDANLKFVKKDLEGFVPIPFLENFRKVKKTLLAMIHWL